MNSLERAQKKVEDLKKVNEELTTVLKPIVEAIEKAVNELTEKSESATKSVKAMISPVIKKLIALKAKAVL